MNERDYSFYIDRAKQVQGFKTDLQVNQALGFKGSVASLLRKSKMHLSDENMINLANLAGIDETVALMDLGILRCEGNAKKAYKRILEKMTAAALIALFIVALSGTPSMAENGLGKQQHKHFHLYILSHLQKIIKTRLLRLKRAALRFFNQCGIKSVRYQDTLTHC